MDRTILIALIAALVAVLAVFAIWPGVDLAVSGFFYSGGRFLGASDTGKELRDFFRITPYALLIVLVLAYGLRRFGLPVPAPSGRAAFFLVATMAIGPGLIVNLGMKDHLHRPRPAHVLEFGGEAPFMPWYRFDGACAKNCGFASGEAAQAFWMIAPAFLAPPPWPPVAIVGALLFGFFASLLRIAFGGHFLSDATVGGLIALIVVFAFKRALWPRGGP